MSKSIEEIKKYKPYNEQEEGDKQFFIDCEKKFGDVLHRENEFCHLCGSAFIVNKERTKTLCVYHNIYKSWTFPGGHADGDDDMLYVAKKEVGEETSLKNFKTVSEQPVSIDTLAISSHYRKGKYVPAHIHLSVVYLFEADEKDSIKILEDENSNVGWLTFDELINKSTEPHMVKVFKKIIERATTGDMSREK